MAAAAEKQRLADVARQEEATARVEAERQRTEAEARAKAEVNAKAEMAAKVPQEVENREREAAVGNVVLERKKLAEAEQVALCDKLKRAFFFLHTARLHNPQLQTVFMLLFCFILICIYAILLCLCIHILYFSVVIFCMLLCRANLPTITSHAAGWGLLENSKLLALRG